MEGNNIELVIELIKSIPDFFLYVAPGYLFIFVFQFVLFQDEDVASKISHRLLNSLIASFILKVIFDFIINPIANHSNFQLSRESYSILILLFSVICGYLTTKFVCSDRASRIREFLGINRTANDNIWNDIIKEDMWVRIWLKSENLSYYGQIKLCESYKREPLIVLEYYQILNEYSEPLVDNTNDKKRTVLLNLSQFERMEIVER